VRLTPQTIALRGCGVGGGNESSKRLTTLELSIRIPTLDEKGRRRGKKKGEEEGGKRKKKATYETGKIVFCFCFVSPTLGGNHYAP